MTELQATEFEVLDESDVIQVRQRIRALTEIAGLGLVDQTKLITAGSELVRNILNYATDGRGRARIELISDGTRRGVLAEFSDDGPGIPDVEAALQDGYSTGGSLGLGLPGARRLVDDMKIDSTPGSGTVVTIVKWKR